MNVLIRWSLLWTIILFIIVVPFLFFHESIEKWTLDLLAGNSSGIILFFLGVMLLAGDILLPVPSSIISTGMGSIFGMWGGLSASWLGMTLGCALGYWLGNQPGRVPSEKILGKGEVFRLIKADDNLGVWYLIICRPVPVLAEASTFFAGLSKIPMNKFFLLTGSSNLGISFVYVYIGAKSLETESFLLAFGGAMFLPLISLGIVRALRI